MSWIFFGLRSILRHGLLSVLLHQRLGNCLRGDLERVVCWWPEFASEIIPNSTRKRWHERDPTVGINCGFAQLDVARKLERCGKRWKAMEGHGRLWKKHVWHLDRKLHFQNLSEPFCHYLSTMCKILHIICDLGKVVGLGTWGYSRCMDDEDDHQRGQREDSRMDARRRGCFIIAHRIHGAGILMLT